MRQRYILINSATLLIMFKSKPVQAMLKKRCSGTILTAISKEEFVKMPLPKVGENTQKQIAKVIQKSFQLREKSKQLLKFTDLNIKFIC